VANKTVEQHAWLMWHFLVTLKAASQLPPAHSTTTRGPVRPLGLEVSQETIYEDNRPQSPNTSRPQSIEERGRRH